MASCVEQQGDCGQEPEKSTEFALANDETMIVNTEESNMFRIPAEIRADIFERLDAQSILQLRCTHPILKSLVDHYIGVNVTMTEITRMGESEKEMKTRFEFYGKVALRNLLIGHLDYPTWDDVNVRTTAKSSVKAFTAHFERLFLHPEFLKNIHLEGPLHVYYMRKLFLCCPNLINLSASANACIVGGLIFSRLDSKNLTYEKATTHLFKIHLPKLKFLKLFVMDPSKTFLNVNQMENSLSLMRTVWSNCLKRIILQIWITPQYSFHSVCWIIVTFLKLHPTLRTIFICFLYDYSVSDTNLDALTKSEEVKLYKELSNVSKTMKLEKFGISSKSAHIKVWEGFIGVQNNLNHLSLTFSANRFSNWEHLTQSSAKSLNQIFIRGEFWVPFDCFSLEGCTNLDEICLHNTSENGTQQNSILKNVSYVPSRVRSLILFNTAVATEDILYLLKKLDKLETLVLFKTGRGNGNGVDVNCLEQAFQIRTLMSVLIVRFVAIDRKDAKRIMEMMDMQDHNRPPTITIPDDSDWETDDDSDDTDETDHEITSPDEDSTTSIESEYDEFSATMDEMDSSSEHTLMDEHNNNTLISEGHSADNVIELVRLNTDNLSNHSQKVETEDDTQECLQKSPVFSELTKVESRETIEKIFSNETQQSIESTTDEENLSAVNSETDWTGNEGIANEVYYLRHENISNKLYMREHISCALLLEDNKSNHYELEENTTNDTTFVINPLINDLHEDNTSSDDENISNDDFHEESISNDDLHEESISDDGGDDDDDNHEYPLQNMIMGNNGLDGMQMHLNFGNNILFNVENDGEDFFEFEEGENNIAAINVNPNGNDLQLVFNGDIDLEDIDLQEIIQVPEVQVHFVLDTILDVLATNIRHSHWTRSEDIYGNVVFTLKLCMKTDY